MAYSIACLVINTAYEGSLKSHMTFVRVPDPIETLHEMATETSGDIVFVNPELNDLIMILKSSPISILNNLHETRNVVGRSTSYQELYRQPLKGSAFKFLKKIQFQVQV